ncbi:MAG TPA: hypothetical protein DD713_09105 [Nitrospiraceae bacterium]|nr:hypothetical protein [Nitrospiraceae bacterium]
MYKRTRCRQKGLVPKASGKGAHRKRRPRAPYVGMMLHQDGSRHEWVTGKFWDLIVTMDAMPRVVSTTQCSL